MTRLLLNEAASVLNDLTEWPDLLMKQLPANVFELNRLPDDAVMLIQTIEEIAGKLDDVKELNEKLWTYLDAEDAEFENGEGI